MKIRRMKNVLKWQIEELSKMELEIGNTTKEF